MSDYSYEHVKQAVFHSTLGKEPGTYVADHGTVKLTITRTNSGVNAYYNNGFQAWDFYFTDKELKTGILYERVNK